MEGRSRQMKAESTYHERLAGKTDPGVRLRFVVTA